ncbi:NADH-ubiquinone oxidoreductase B12 subunit family-domain-containing protein [Xylariaceae sp. FL0594]|nr:NADH-ubiquinone oxidoreductase B12 subunit family-domain-containing protein [Xylariaceae sp. FL0594]
MYLTRILRAHHGPKPNITGFDPKQFANAAGHPRYDPWERHEQWRYTGQFSRWNRFKASFPGLGIATVAFVVYLGYEQLFLKEDHHHGGDAHGKEHH